MLSQRSQPATAGPAALPGRLRRPAAGAVALAVVTLAVLAVRYGGDDSAGRLDRRLDAAAERVRVPYALVRYGVVLGSPALIGVLALIVAAVAAARGYRRFALLALVGPLVTGLATTVLKPVVGRTIDGEAAYPSGHTGGATALALVVALLVVHLRGLRRLAGLVTVVGGALPVGGGVGLAVTVLGWPSSSRRGAAGRPGRRVRGW